MGLLSRRPRSLNANRHQTKSVCATDTLARCLHKAGKSAEALKYSRDALRLKTPEAGFLFHAGLISKGMGDRNAAKKYLCQALSLNPAFHPIHSATAVAVLKELGSRGNAKR